MRGLSQNEISYTGPTAGFNLRSHFYYKSQYTMSIQFNMTNDSYHSKVDLKFLNSHVSLQILTI